MSESNDIRKRLDQQESYVQVACLDAQAARVLAAKTDQDIADVQAQLRAHTGSLNALRETQVEQGQELKALRTEMRTEFADVRTEMRAGYTELKTEMGSMKTDIGGMKTDIGGMKTDIGDMKADIQVMKADIGTLKGGLDEITTLLRHRPRDA